MIACIAPDLTSTNHTLNTLRYSDRLKEKTNAIKTGTTATPNSMNKLIVNPLINSTSDTSNLKQKNYLFDIDMNDSSNKNGKGNSKDFPILKTNANLKMKNLMANEDFVNYF